MNTSGSEIKILAGNASKELAEKIAKQLNVPVLDCEVGTFSDGEICVNHERNCKRLRRFRCSVY